MLLNIYLFFVIVVAFADAIISPNLAQPWVPEPNWQQDWMPWNWKNRVRANVENNRVKNSSIHLLFLGDHYIDNWDWNRTYSTFGVAKYGTPSDRTQHLLWRIMNGEVDHISPKLIVLQIGTCNLSSNTEADIARGIIKIVDELRIRQPKSKILVLGIMPIANLEFTAFFERTNAIFASTENGKTVRYLNMRDAFYAGNGKVFPGLFHKLVQLTTAGYAKWEATMKPLFTEMWNAP